MIGSGGLGGTEERRVDVVKKGGGGDRNREESQLQGEGRRDVSVDGYRCRKQIQNLWHRGDRFSTREKLLSIVSAISAARRRSTTTTAEAELYCNYLRGIVTTAVRCESASTSAVDLV